MSLFNVVRARCPACETVAEHDVVVSVNAGRRPDLRDDIIAGTFQAVICETCAARFRLPPRFTYLDFGRGQWILAHPADEIAGWQTFEDQASQVFAATFGPSSPAASRLAGANLVARVTFGWPALREKLIIHALGLDDIVVELLKMAVLRSISGSPAGDTAELRLTGGDDGSLTLTWMNTETEAELAAVSTPRAAYDAIVADPGGWEALQTDLSGRTFVDLQRLLLPAA